MVNEGKKGNEKEYSGGEVSGKKASRRKESSDKEGKPQAYGEWNQEELLQKAGELGIEGRSAMDKQELIKAIKDH